MQNQTIEGEAMENCKVTMIGPAIVDIMAGPISENIFRLGSIPMDEIKMTFGGNGYNESYVLNRFGVDVDLITKLGKDEAGRKVLEQLRSLGIRTDHVIMEDGLPTSINIVLFDEQGERRFLTNPQGSQRRLSEADVEKAVETCADIVCFSCMFISPLFDIPSMERIFRKIKQRPERVLVVDMTKAKNGESVRDLAPLLPYVDYILPNEEELKLLGGDDIRKSAVDLLHYGAGCVVVKRGSRGCTVFTGQESFDVEAFKEAKVIDTTGAGDTFAAGFIYGLLHQKPLAECARFANAAASCCVESVGATEGVVSVEEPARRYEMMCGLTMEGK